MQLELVTLGPRIEEKAVDTEVLLKQLEKDQEAVDQVREIVLSEEAVMKRETEIVQEYADDTEVLLKQLEKDQEAVDQVREIVLSEEAVMKRETEIVQEYADACQADLASVIPSLHAAITSLDSLDKADISEIRVYAHPPALVIMVMAAVCVLLEEKTSWPTAKQVLGDPQFLKKLVGLDKNAVPERVYTKLKRYTRHPDFTPEKVGQVSVACKSMCQWVLALENYHEVYKMAKPKQRKVKEAKEALAMAQSHLAHKQMSLAKIQAHFEMLQQQYVDSVNQRESLKEHKALTALRLERASILIEALSNEKVRWEEAVRLLDFKLKGLVGNTLVSAGMVAYVGPFTSGYRQELAADWLARCHEKAIPISDDYEFVRNLVDANQILRWNNEGLPNDSNSTQNAIIMKKARKWPLLIDPQCQASQWIQQMEGQQLKCVNASDTNYLHSIERAIRIGEAVLLQEVTEDLDPSLKPILLQNTFVKGGHTLIKIGDTEIEYNSNFRLYLATSLSNPHYLPAICIQVTLINFTVTFNALQEQLLSSVVKQEQPQLENDRSHLLQLIANDQMVLRDLEDKSLSLLQKSQGHILDDHVLVETLQASKGMSEEMHERVQNSRLTEQKLSAARKKYLPVATRGAVLYFGLADLATVDVMYQFSLTWFYEMFSSCIDLVQSPHSKVSSRHSSFSHSSSGRPAPGRMKASEATQGEDLTVQLDKMISRLTTSIYKIVSVALFAHHQLMFSFMLCTSIMRSNAYVTSSQVPVDGATGNDTISQLEWHLFLQGHIMAGMLDDDTCKQHDGRCSMKERPGVVPLWDGWHRAVGGSVALCCWGIGGIVPLGDGWHCAIVGDAGWHRAVGGWVASCHWGMGGIVPLWDGWHHAVGGWVALCHWGMHGIVPLGDGLHHAVGGMGAIVLLGDGWHCAVECQNLEAKFDSFSHLCPSIVNTPNQWTTLAQSHDPYHLMVTKYTPTQEEDASRYAVVFPWQQLTSIQRLILVHILCPSTLTAAIRHFVFDHMGASFLSSGTADLQEMYEESSAKTPFIFILSPGSDPAAQLLRFAKELRGSTLHLDIISLGRGQGPRAEELILKAQILKGRWIFLQNCHLAASWMPRLQAIVDSFNKPDSDVDPQFRLWLSSKPDPSFPVSILQMGLKVGSPMFQLFSTIVP
ncbi:hypothetical protein NP493_153g03014 [Ridgeia piscesae]|uniref:Dynein heavy chain n=1 Tax=Ridgeia piscesae TaxID=27915 RepID=A0AAD9UFW2_RIDPI|nr:hypothetical protein NP493_153g03014 [Ridgeia piscesae]